MKACGTEMTRDQKKFQKSISIDRYRSIYWFFEPQIFCQPQVINYWRDFDEPGLKWKLMTWRWRAVPKKSKIDIDRSILIDSIDRSISIMIENDNMAENISSRVSNESGWGAEFISACYYAIRSALVDRRSILVDSIDRSISIMIENDNMEWKHIK